jgi:hypothetical protein
MQAISDHSVCNNYEDSVKRRFSLTTPDDIKKILHENGDTFFYVFDVLNFFHSFRPTDEVREKIKTITDGQRPQGKSPALKLSDSSSEQKFHLF